MLEQVMVFYHDVALNVNVNISTYIMKFKLLFTQKSTPCFFNITSI